MTLIVVFLLGVITGGVIGVLAALVLAFVFLSADPDGVDRPTRRGADRVPPRGGCIINDLPSTPAPTTSMAPTVGV